MGRTQKAHLTAFQYLDLGLSNLSEVGPCRPCLILFGRQNILLFANFGIQDEKKNRINRNKHGIDFDFASRAGR